MLSRQLDGDAGRMVLEQVKALDVDVLLKTRVKDLVSSKQGDVDVVEGLLLENGDAYPCEMVVFAVGITPRDELATASGIETHSRGGILVKDDLTTSAPNVYAVGECASWKGETYGLIAPGVEMADILAFNLTEGVTHKMRAMTTPDLSTKLKLMGVNVASFGDYFADRKPPGTVDIPGHKRRAAVSNKADSATATESTKIEVEAPSVRALTYHDPFSFVYKKYLFSADGKYLLGGMMIGDVTDYVKVLSITKKRVSTSASPRLSC